MAALKRLRWERFAQELAKGKTGDEAYVLAGYAQNRGNAARLKAEESVFRRVEELKGKAAHRVLVTVESLLREAEEARQAAMAAGQISAAVAAIREKGVLSGQRIEKRENGNPGDFDRMSDDELERYITQRERELRQGVSGESTAH